MSALAAVAVLVGTLALVAAALLLAQLLRIDRLLHRSLGMGPLTGDTGSCIEYLATIAEMAHREGLLMVERSPRVQCDPLLRTGLALAAEGEPGHEIRRQLKGLIQPASARSIRALLPRTLQIVALVTLTALLLALLIRGAGAGVAAVTFPLALAAWLTLCASMVSLSIAAAVADRFAPAAQIETALRIEAVVLMAAGRRGSQVRESLQQMVAQPAREPLPRAA